MQTKYPLINFDPVAVSLGPLDLPFFGEMSLDVHWYGVMYLLAFTAFWSIGSRIATTRPWYGWSKQEVGDFLFYGMIGVIIGGRVGYMLFYGFEALIDNPLSLFRIWDGGMSFHGGLIGLILTIVWFAHRTQKSFWQVADFVAPIGPLCLALGRVGNFIGGELWGRLTDVSWAMIFAKSTGFGPNETEALNEAWRSGALDHLARHPSQLYQAGLEGLSLFFILMWYSAKPRPRAAVSGMFLIGYGAFRLFAEFFRQPDDHLGFLAMHWLTMGMALSFPMIAAGIVILLYAYRSRPQTARG